MIGYKVIQKELITPSGRAVRFVYKNYRGEIRLRRAKPLTVFWGSNRWHPDEQWLMHAYDLEKKAHRTFALAGIQPWDPVKNPQPHMVVFKQGRETESHSIGQGYNLERRVLKVGVDRLDVRQRTIVHYVTGRDVKTACYLESWSRWAKEADRAWWDGELTREEKQDMLGDVLGHWNG